MWFKRMPLEEWFDTYQYLTEFDIGESAVKYLSTNDLDLELSDIPLRYGHHKGRPDLRGLIAQQYLGLSPDEIIVTSGASEANFAVIAAIMNPGNHIIVEHPNYPSLYEVPRSLGCHVSLFPLRYKNRFIPDLEELKSMITSETKLISLTHPNNPTGSMITVRELQALIELVESRGLLLLFDETYREMAYSEPLPPAASLSKNVVSISSMSKVFGLPGIRIGWAATKNSDVSKAILSIREQLSICNNAISEHIATFVLERKKAFLDGARNHIKGNLEIVQQWMAKQTQIEWIPPQAGVVCLPRLKPSVNMDPEHLYTRLARDYKTFVIPGRCFEMENSHFRLGFGANAKEIETGLSYMEEVLEGR